MNERLTIELVLTFHHEVRVIYITSLSVANDT